MAHHGTGTCIGHRGLTLFYQFWLPEDSPKALFVIVHGLGEHGGRYEKTAEVLTENGYAVFTHDHQGHGQSEGVRCDVKQIEDYVYDLQKSVAIARERYPDIPVFLFGHSMGGGIAALYACWHGENLAGLILSGATISVGQYGTPLLKAISKVLSVIVPTIPMIPLAWDKISSDPAVLESRRNDPLVYQGKVRARLGYELLRIETLFLQCAPRLTLPVLLFHGADDVVVLPASTELAYQAIPSNDKTFHLLDGRLHEILSEPGKERVLESILNWLEDHV